MGKKFKKVALGVVAIVAAVFTYGGSLSYFFLNAGIQILANVALSAFASSRRQGAPPINVTLRGTVEYRRIIFGTRRCGGVLVFYGTSGTDNKYLWYVIAYAGHQCSAFSDFWLDERRIASSDIPSGSGGTVTASPWSSKLQIFKHLGTSAQTVDTNLSAAFGAWTSTHKLQGIAYAVIRMERDDTAFPDGAPQSISSLMDGALTYDARLDSTNGGSGSHRYANPSTWAFSRDPAQHIRWLLTGGSVHNDLSTCLKLYGLRELDARIDDAYTVAASNVCDQTLSGASAPPSGSQVRYRCDLEADCGETRRDILTALLASMAGTLTYVHGKWRIYAGAYDVPPHSVTDADLYGELEVQDTVGHDVRYNAVAPIYVDADKQYLQTTGIYRTDSAYETQDGSERIATEIRLDAVTNIYQAQRLAEIHLRKSRMMRAVKLIGALNLLKIAPHETLLFTHTRYGWSNRVFRCKERQLEFTEEAGRVTVQAQRDDSGVWTDLLTADYDSGTSDTDVFTSDSPIAAEDTWLTLDPEVRSETPSVFWTMGSKASLSTTGGIRGGIITLAATGSTPNPNFRSQRGVGRSPIALGQSVAFTARYRRTTTLTSTSANPALIFSLERWDAISGGSSIGDSIDSIDLSGLVLNTWNEKTLVVPVTNTFGNNPYVDFNCSLGATDLTGSANGTLEIDYLLAYVQNSLAGVARFLEFTGTAYTVGSADRYTTTRTTSSSAITITLPNAVPDGWSIGQKTEFIRGGTGTVTFSTAGTLRSPGGSSITVTNGKGIVQLVGAGVWELSGNV